MRLAVCSQSLAESSLTGLEDFLLIFQVLAFLGDIFRLRSDVRDLFVAHIGDDEGREGAGAEIVEQMTLDDLFGDGSDEGSNTILRGSCEVSGKLYAAAAMSHLPCRRRSGC